MPSISLSDFLDFVARTGSPKLTKVRDVMNRSEYDPATDFWKPLRDGIVAHHRGGHEKRALDRLIELATTKRQARYEACVAGYKKFLGRKSITWFKPPNGTWSRSETRIRVNPELGLMINGERHVLKLYFKAEKLAKLRTDAILLLMHRALAGKVPRGTLFGIIDVARGKFFADAEPKSELLPLLAGEAASFASIYNQL